MRGEGSKQAEKERERGGARRGRGGLGTWEWVINNDPHTGNNHLYIIDPFSQQTF